MKAPAEEAAAAPAAAAAAASESDSGEERASRHGKKRHKKDKDKEKDKKKRKDKVGWGGGGLLQWCVVCVLTVVVWCVLHGVVLWGTLDFCGVATGGQGLGRGMPRSVPTAQLPGWAADARLC